MADESKKDNSVQSDHVTEIMDHFTDGFFALDRDWRFIRINKRAASTLGLVPADLIGRNIWEKYPQLIGTQLESMYRRAMRERQSGQLELKWLINSAWYHIRIYPSDEGILVYWHDITELLKAEAEIARLTSFPLFNPNPVLELDLSGSIKFLNPAAKKVFPELLTARKNHPLLADFESVAGLLQKRTLPSITWDTKIGNSWFEQTLLYVTEEQHIRIYARDITQRKEAEDALKKLNEELEHRVKERTAKLAESEEKYRLLVENANEAVYVVENGQFKFFNSKAQELFGYTREEMASIPVTNTIHPDDRSRVAEIYLKRIRNEESPARYETRSICKDGSVKWIDVNVVSIPWEGKIASLLLLTDITQRKNMEQELKDYVRKITRVQEEERKRIAYELHDDTAQYLAILKLQLDSIIHSGKVQSPEILEKLRLLELDAGRAVEDVRRYSHELRPGVLEHLGLHAALEQITNDTNKLHQIKVELIVKGEEKELTEEVKLGFFRIAQEAINNCRKHAQADKVIIYLSFSESRISMVVSDNGKGFNPQEAAVRSGNQGSLGLMSMRERARLIGADLQIQSEPGKGTRIITDLII